jgi:cyclohexa-1,5-dienecarbonyl-CoA hydratase
MTYARLDVTERVAWLTLDHGPLNILSSKVMAEVQTLVKEAAANGETSVIVIGSASERAFSAGVDISEHEPDKVPQMLESFHGLLRTIMEVPQVTVAAIDGVALGGGMELALACDIAVASERSEIGFPEIKLACFPPMGLMLLPALCGRQVASGIQSICGRKF